LAITFTDPHLQAQRADAVDLLFGLWATLEISQADQVWRDEAFLIIEFAVFLARSSCAVPFRYSSMDMEEEPVLATEQSDDVLTLVTYTGERFVVTEDELRSALRQFAIDVDRTARTMCGRSLANLERALRR